jgi:serine/threonine protein kinase
MLHGRGRLGSFALANGETALIRTYRHGGVLRPFTRDLFLSWPPRPFRELAITEEIRRRGIPTVEVYAACVKRTLGPLYRGWLVTRQLKGAQDLWAAIQNGQFHTLGAARVLQAVADGLRSLHREGVYHRDLNLKNILVRREPDGVKGYIIDFDRAVLFFGTVPPTLARRNLNRLLRSARKLDPTQRYFSAANWKQFVAFYYGHAEEPRS